MTTAPHGDPTQRFADLLDSMDVLARSSARTARLDERNRLNLLFFHGVFAMLVAPGFMALAKSGMSSPTFVLLRGAPGAPWSLAVWIGVSGAALAITTFRRNRLGEYVSLGAMALWYLVTFFSFVGAVVLWIRAPGPPDWHHAPSLYAPIVYCHLAYTMCTHMYTLRRKGLIRRERG